MTLSSIGLKAAQPTGQQAAQRPHDVVLEAVRGVAAFYVALSHVFWLQILSMKFQIPPMLRVFEAGHAGVLIFFVLSGYVISWTNNEECTQSARRLYARRRITRLAPIYLVSIALTTWVTLAFSFPDATRELIGATLCVQNYNDYFGHIIHPPQANGPLWSLNYEVLFYVLFPILWKFRPRFSALFIPCVAAAILAWFDRNIMPLFLSSFAMGWAFWIAGWWLAKQPKLDESDRDAPIATWMLLVFANHHIGGVERGLNLLHLYSIDSGMVTLADIGALPAIILTLAAAGRRKLRFERSLQAAAWGICIVPIIGMVFTGRLASHADWEIGAIATTCALALLPLRSTRWLAPFAWFGGISYAFYVVHFPLLYVAQALHFPDFSPTGLIGRTIAWAAMSVFLAWLLERKFQPWVKRRLAPGQIRLV